ncbi:MAG: class I SAM-dependent methyltransferase [Motiliproteus sp.]
MNEDTKVNDPGQWPTIARNWKQIGSPLRPVIEDNLYISAAIDNWFETSAVAPKALILGVTPELYHAHWPEGSVLHAADRTIEMIENLWPGDTLQVQHSTWLDMDWPESNFDLVLCDGGLHLLDYPIGQQALVEKLAHILAPSGVVVFRLFVLPEHKEDPLAIIEHLLNGKIPNLNCLKLRLGMALQESPETGVALQHVWQFLHDNCGEWSELATKLGWSLEHLSAIDAYKESQARYHFLSTKDVIALFSEDSNHLFELTRLDIPGYEMGNQCPTVVFHRADEQPAIA